MRFVIGWLVFWGLSWSTYSLAAQEQFLKQWQEHILTELKKSLPKKSGQNVSLPPSINFAVKNILAPVFKARGQFVDYKLSGAKINGEFHLIIEITTLSYFKGTTDREWVEGSYRAGSQYLMGNYRIVLRNEEPKIPGIPNLVRVVNGKNNTEHGDNTRDNRVEGELHLSFPFNNLESVSNTQIQLMQNRLRSLVRADAILHPHSNLDEHVKSSAPMVPSEPQQETINALVHFSREYHKKGDFSEPLKMGMIMPVGMGKSFTSARLISTLHTLKELPTPPRMVITLENTLMLDTLARTFANQFNLSTKKIRKIYGDHLKSVWDQDFSEAQLILVSRSSYYTHMKKIHDWVIKDKKSSWAFVFDEAHHLGKTDGQFESIFNGRDDIPGLNEVLGAKDLVLLMSATLWREDANLVTRILKGRVFGPFLNPQELSQLQKGEDLEKLCQKQFFRAISAGYLSPIYGLRVHHTVGGEPIHKLLNDTQKVDSVEDLQSQLTVHMAIVQHLRQQILKNRIKGVFDHGVIFVPTIYHANLYAGLLNEAFGASTLFRPYHSGRGVNRDEVEDWFIYNKKIQSHKYLLVVDILKEAIDIPGINLEVFLVNMIKLKTKMQSLGRGSRLDQGKTDLRALDYSGSMVDILSDELGRESLVEEIPTYLMSRPFNTHRAPPLLSVDDKTVSVDQIQQESVEVLSKGMELADEVSGIEGARENEQTLTASIEKMDAVIEDLESDSNYDVISKTGFVSPKKLNLNNLEELALKYLSLVKERQYLLIEAEMTKIYKDAGLGVISQDLEVLFKDEKVNVHQRLREIEDAFLQLQEIYLSNNNYSDKDIVAFERIMWEAQQSEFILTKEILFPYKIALQIEKDKNRVLEVVIAKIISHIQTDIKSGKNSLNWYLFLSNAFADVQSMPKRISQQHTNQLISVLTTPANSMYGLCDGTDPFSYLMREPVPIRDISDKVEVIYDVTSVIQQMCTASLQFYAHVGDIKRDLIRYVLVPSWKDLEFRDKVRLADYIVYELNHLQTFDLDQAVRTRDEKRILTRQLLQYLVTLMQQLLSGNKSEAAYLANYIKKSFFDKLVYGNISELVRTLTSILLENFSLNSYFNKEWYESHFPTFKNILLNDQLFERMLESGVSESVIDEINLSPNRLYKWLRLAQIEKAQGLSEEQKQIRQKKFSEHTPSYQLYITQYIASHNLQENVDSSLSKEIKNEVWNQLKKYLSQAEENSIFKLEFAWQKSRYHHASDDRDHIAMKIIRLYLKFKKEDSVDNFSYKEELLFERVQMYADYELEKILDQMKSFDVEYYNHVKILFQNAAIAFFETQDNLDVESWLNIVNSQGQQILVFTEEYFLDYWHSEEVNKQRWMEHLFYFLSGFENKENNSYLEKATLEYLQPYTNELSSELDPSSNELTPLEKWHSFMESTSSATNDNTSFLTYLLTNTFKLALDKKLTKDRQKLITNLYFAVLNHRKHYRYDNRIHSWYGVNSQSIILEDQKTLVKKYLDMIVDAFKNGDHQVKELLKTFLPSMSEHVFIRTHNLINFVNQLFSIKETSQFIDEELLTLSLNFVLKNSQISTMRKSEVLELYQTIIQNVNQVNWLGETHPLIVTFVMRAFARMKEVFSNEIDNLDNPILLKFYLNYLKIIPPYARDKHHFRVRNLFIAKISESLIEKRGMDFDVEFFSAEMDWLINYNYTRLGEDPAEITKGNVFKSSEEYWEKWSEIFEKWSKTYPEKSLLLSEKKEQMSVTQKKILLDGSGTAFLKLPRNLHSVYSKVRDCEKVLE